MPITPWHTPTCRRRGYARCCEPEWSAAKTSRYIELFAVFGRLGYRTWQAHRQFGPIVTREQADRGYSFYARSARVLVSMFLDGTGPGGWTPRPDAPDISRWSEANVAFIRTEMARCFEADRRFARMFQFIPVAEASQISDLPVQTITRWARSGRLGNNAKRLPTGYWACRRTTAHQLKHMKRRNMS